MTMQEVLTAHSVHGMSGGTHLACRCNRAWVLMAEYRAHLEAELTAAGFGPVKEAAAKALEEAADAWREYLPAVAGYGKVQPVPVWLERRAEWIKR